MEVKLIEIKQHLVFPLSAFNPRQAINDVRIKMVLDSVIDMMMLALKRLARKSSSKVEDELVTVLRENRGEIIRDIKSRL